MSNFKDYSDDQLINQFLVLADEIIERNLDLKLVEKVDEKHSLEKLSSLILFNNAFSENDLETTDEMMSSTIDKITDAVDDLHERAELD